MREFFTKVAVPQSDRLLSYDDKILLLGSCFADNIGAKFQEYYFQVTVNPFGTLYNPASIAQAMVSSCCGLGDEVRGMLGCNSSLRLLLHNGLWHSMSHHGAFSHPDQKVVARRCQDSMSDLGTALQDASTIIVTFGTAWVYELDGLVVANCHKMPTSRFTRRCMSVDEIVSIWGPIVSSMPDKHWIFTVSPIRHLKDGLHANQLSKAILLQAIDQLTLLCSDALRVSYFPSYEIMMDELRDYRFYAEDMVHPSDVAVEYIWERFVGSYVLDKVVDDMRVMHQLWLDRHHRFLHPESEEALLFARRTESRLRELQECFPWLS